MASANSTRAKTAAIDPSNVNPLIGDTADDTRNRVEAALRFLSLTSSYLGNGHTVMNEIEGYGFSLIIDSCAAALALGDAKGGAA